MFWKNKKTNRSSKTTRSWWTGRNTDTNVDLDTYPSQGDVSNYYQGLSNQFRCVVPEGVELEGDIQLATDSLILGAVTGNVEGLAKVVLAPSAEVSGSINCEDLMNFGKISGEVQADKVTIYPDASVEANLNCKELKFSDSAKLNGQCQVGSAK